MFESSRLGSGVAYTCCNERNMEPEYIIDMTYAKNALFVRQTLAKVAGLPINQEISWQMLRDAMCAPANTSMPKNILFEGLSSMSLQVPKERERLRELLDALAVARPDIKVMVVLH